MKMTVTVDMNASGLTDPGVVVGTDSIVAHLTQKTLVGVGGNHTTNWATLLFSDGTIVYFVADEHGPRLTVQPVFKKA